MMNFVRGSAKLVALRVTGYLWLRISSVVK
jgi:hypothetical protein